MKKKTSSTRKPSENVETSLMTRMTSVKKPKKKNAGSTKNAVESTANAANVVGVDASLAVGSADEKFDGFGEAPNAEGDARASAVQAVALFPYTAADDEDVSFEKDDEFVDVEEAEEGWLKGTVLRTGETGTFPANYVQSDDAAA